MITIEIKGTENVINRPSRQYSYSSTDLSGEIKHYQQRDVSRSGAPIADESNVPEVISGCGKRAQLVNIQPTSPELKCEGTADIKLEELKIVRHATAYNVKPDVKSDVKSERVPELRAVPNIQIQQEKSTFFSWFCCFNTKIAPLEQEKTRVNKLILK